MDARPYDAVVIGAGPSGLAAAARMAHFGVRVCLLEAHGRPGGLSSWHQVGGREISSGLHAVTNYAPDGRSGPLGKLLRQLRIRYADLGLKPQGQSSVRFPSATLSFTNEPEFFRQQVASVFPGDIDGFDRFRRLVADTDEGEITRRQTSAREVLESHIRNPLLADMLLCPVMFYGNPGGVGDGKDAGRARPDMDWLLFCVVWKCIFESGFAHPADGMRPLWELLAGRIREGGGIIRLRTPVKELLADGDRVLAAALGNGETVRADLFFSSAGAAETERLLADPSGVPGNHAEPSPPGAISIAEGICLLDGPAPDVGMRDTVIFYSFEDEFRFRRPDGLVDESNGVLCAPGNYLPARPADNIIKASQLASYPAWKAVAPRDYQEAKARVGAGMTAAMRRLGISPAKTREAPGRYAVFEDLFTPLTLERYTGHIEGALYGSPVKRRDGLTSRPNLFLIGADQGFHGIVGAMLSGVAMANRHCLAARTRGGADIF